MKTILVIEANSSMALAFQETLQTEGFAVALVSDGNSGVAAVSRLQPDLILLDLQVVDAKSSTLIPTLREAAGGRALPVIALGNHYDRKSVDEAWEAGISNCLYKANCTPVALASAINDALSSEQQAAMLESIEKSSALEMAPALAVRATLRESFLREIPQVLAQMRPQLAALLKADDMTRPAIIQELQARAGTLSTNAGMAELKNLGDLSSALEALLKDLYEKPKKISPSALRTIALAIDFLGMLSQNRIAANADFSLFANILAVDDEPFSRKAVVEALGRTNLKCVAVDSPDAALALLKENRFELAILDIDMPGMNGLDLCKNLRLLPHHKETPVIFVTSLSDFENRAKSTLVGGSDLIGKPFALMELAVKALIYVQKAQLKAPA